MKIGLFGGTFDPPHEAHLAACLLAMKRLGLDRVWWLVTPRNPLKDRKAMPLAERIRIIDEFVSHPRIAVTGFEQTIRSHYTYTTVSFLRRRCPGVRFVWIMGADNLRNFHHWQKWQELARLVPIAVVDRLGSSHYATGGIAAQTLARWRVPETQARILAERSPPAWTYLHGLKSGLSSTELRRRAQHNA